MLKFMGGKIMGKLAPRLIFFQYSNLVSNELDSKKRRYKMLQIRSQTEWLIHELNNSRYAKSQGLSELREVAGESWDEANIFEESGRWDLLDTKTVVSEYDDYQLDFEFYELYSFTNPGIKVSSRTFDHYTLYSLHKELRLHRTPAARPT